MTYTNSFSYEYKDNYYIAGATIDNFESFQVIGVNNGYLKKGFKSEHQAKIFITKLLKDGTGIK